MKGSSGVVASVIALSTVAVSSSSSSSSSPASPHHCPISVQGTESRKTNASQQTDKFAPRFDGLRFIETLVTAHR